MDISQLHQAFLSSTGVCYDSRKLKAGQIFFALTGDRDGHEFVDTALEGGAMLAVISNPSFSRQGRTLLVADTLEALQELGRFHRRQFNIPVIGITGSNGKTTTKELLHVVLSRKFNTLATAGNLNNHIGVPMTLLELHAGHEMAIIEMGANHQREIALLSSVAEPTHGLITSIGKAHLEGFGGPEGVKKGKGELYEWLKSSGGTLFLNKDVQVLCEMASVRGLDVAVTYGSAPDADYQFTLLGAEPMVKFTHGDRIVTSRLPGAYNYNNLITAYTVGLHFGVPEEEIVVALQSYEPDNKRSQLISWQGHTVVMDAYNANPTSMNLALENFAQMPGAPKVAILGDMLELGEYSDTEHQLMAEKVSHLPVEYICLTGDCFAKVEQADDRVWKAADYKEARQWLDSLHLKHALILLKGSRGITLEKVIQD